MFNGSGYYRCLIAHTSGVFATDLAALKWQLIVNLAAVPLVNASQIAVTPSGSLTSDAQGSLQALDTGKAALSHTHVSSAISDSTAAGRALLTAADATAQNALLGTTSLGFQSGDVKETAVLVLQSGWYYCDGSNKNRVTDVNLFNAITIQQSGVLTSASAVVTGLSDTSNMSPGMPMSGTNVQAATVIQSVDSATQVTMSLTATGSSTTPLVFAPYGVGDGTTTFGLPNRVYLAVGRDNASGSASNIMQVSTTITTTNGSATATVASATNLFVGMYVNQPKIPVGTKINAIVGTTLTLSATATGTVTAAAVRFSPVLDAQTMGATGGALGQTLALTQIPTGITSANTATIALSVTGTPVAPNNLSSSPSGGASATGTGSAAAMTSTGTLAIGAVPVTSNNTGGQGHNITQSTIVMNYIIKR